ncbi:MFS transporter [Streptomyces sp. NPDC059011]|uniref:MFS transporter n=1 Tax=unclassified Streptomyces TaxID=2593676 RepID=UPI0036B5630C
MTEYGVHARFRLQAAACYAAFAAGGLAISMAPAALPAMARDLGMDRAETQWTASSYPAVAGALQLAVARWSDRLGTRTTLLSGLALFAVATAWGAVISDASLLIAARIVQGVGGSVLTPVTLAFLATQSAPSRRVRAVGGWAATAAAATAAGPLLSGAIVDLWGWRSLYLLLTCESLCALALCRLALPSQSRSPAELDITGMVLCTAVTGTLLVTLLGSSDPPTARAAAFGATAAIGATVLLVRTENRRHDSTLDTEALRDPVRRTLLFALAALFAANSGFLYFSYIYLVQVRGQTTFHSSLLLAAASAPAVITTRLASRYAANSPGVAAVGLTVMACSLFLMPFAGPPHATSLLVYSGTGIGLGLTNSAALAEITLRASRDRAARAAATAATMSMLGGALGPALAGTVVAIHAADWRQGLGLSAKVSEAAYRAASGGAPLEEESHPQSLITAAQEVLTHGISRSFIALGLLTLLAAVLTAIACISASRRRG